MIKDLIRRFGWAVYLTLFLLGIVFLYGSLHWTQDESLRDFFLNISSELVGVALVFFLVNQFLQWNPEEWQKKGTKHLLDQLQTVLEQPHREITPYPSRRAIYDSAITTLDCDHWKKIRIFAPVGLWRADEFKKEWLEALAECAKSEKVETVWGVFGLPPKNKNGIERPRDKVITDLEYAKEKLSLFNGLPNVILNFYPPAHASVGLGALIFQRRDNGGQVAFALSSHGHEEVVDSGFNVDNDEIFSFAIDWFDDRIRKSVGAFILQDETKSLLERWEDVVESWYGKDFLTTSDGQ